MIADFNALSTMIQQIEKLRKTDGGRFRALNQCLAFGAQRGDAECHGDTVVAAGVDGSAVKSLAAGHIESVLELLDLGTHGAQVPRDERDAIGLLYAQFLRVADANAAAGVGSDGRQHRQLVDELSGESTADFCGAKSVGIGSYLDRADELGMLFFEIEDGDVSAESGEHIEQRRAGWIEAQANRVPSRNPER